MPELPNSDSDLDAAVAPLRARFPGLARSGEALLDNAGGSQVPDSVVARMTRYLEDDYVQTGADYARSQRATQRVADAHGIVETMMGAGGHGKVVLGVSTSMLCHVLAGAFANEGAGERDEIVIGIGGHEANMGPWARLESRGFTIRWWPVDPETGASDPEVLRELVGPRTRIVAVHHVSNLLGAIEPLEEVVRIAREVGARVVADGVAYAPHRAIDVGALGVDFYLFSLYKTFGPHLAAMYGSDEAFAELTGPNHFFVDERAVPYRWELGGVPHESAAVLFGIADYLRFASGEPGEGEDLTRAQVERAFERFASLERALMAPLMEFLGDHPDIRVIGPPSSDGRVSTCSFVMPGRSSRAFVVEANARGHGCRHGHFYAHRLATALGLDPDDGVVRVSLLHYNRPQEVRAFLEFLLTWLKG